MTQSYSANDVSQEFLRSRVNYCAETGVFTWIVEPRPRRPLIGTVAGSTDARGYRRITFRGNAGKRANIFEHRAAWIYVHGCIPHGMTIDHANRVVDDNRLENLRLADRTTQNANRLYKKPGQTGFVGVVKHFDRFQAEINYGGQKTVLRSFMTAEEARKAYCVEFAKLHGFPAPERDVT